jgi:hypothetical protein
MAAAFWSYLIFDKKACCSSHFKFPRRPDDIRHIAVSCIAVGEDGDIDCFCYISDIACHLGESRQSHIWLSEREQIEYAAPPKLMALKPICSMILADKAS